jgi:hypothetical protein
MLVFINTTFSDLNHTCISELQCMIAPADPPYCCDVPLNSPLPCGYPMGLSCAMSWSSNQRHFIASILAALIPHVHECSTVPSDVT